MTDEEMLYRYAIRKGFIFHYNEGRSFKEIYFCSCDRVFSYLFDKVEHKTTYRVDDKYYDNIENALQDFDDYELLRENQSLY